MSTIGSAKGSHSTQYVVCRKAKGDYGQILPFLAPSPPTDAHGIQEMPRDAQRCPEDPHGGTAGRSMFKVTP